MANTIDFNVSTNAVTVLNQTGAAAENTAKGFKSAKAELRALQNQLLEMDQTSEEFKKASKRAAELKDTISDLSAEINANAGNAFEGLSNNIGLFGSRLMSLDLKGAGQALRGMGTAVSKIDFKTVKEEVGGLIQGFADLAKSILANPILLLAGVIALVVMNMDKLRKMMPGLDAAMGGLTEQMKAAAKANEASLKAKQLEYDLVMASSALMKEQGMSDKQILRAQQDKAKVLLEQKKITDAQNIANAKADLKRNENLKMVLKGIQEVGLAVPKLMSFVFDAVFAKAKDLLSYVGITIDTSFSAYDTIAGAQMVVLDAIFGNTQEEMQAITEMENQALLSQTQLANTIAQTNLDIKKSDADLAKSKEKGIEDANKLYQDALNAQIAAEDAKYKALQELQETAQEREVTAAVEASEALYKLAGDDAAAQILIAENLKKKIAEINKKYKDAADDEEAKAKEERDKINEANAIEAVKQLNLEKQAAQSMAQLKIDAVKTSLSIIGDLAAAFAGKSEKQQKKAFAIQKGVSVATATIDTYLAAQGAYASQMSIKTPDAPVRAAIAAGIAIAQGLARVAIISKQQFGGGGGTNGGGSIPSVGGTMSPSPANYDFISQQPNQQPPLQAYIVGSQVSSNLEAQQLIQNQSRLGG
jgi:hypothetical protein